MLPTDSDSNAEPVSRRKLLVRTAAVVGASGLLWQAYSRLSLDEIGIAFVGCGIRGETLMDLFDQVVGVRVLGLCDPDPQRLEKASIRYPSARAVFDLRELLDRPEIDAVIIATPDHWHALATVWALDSGKHVYVEKPMAHSLAETQQISQAVDRSGKILQVGLQHRSQTMLSELRDILHESQELGSIRSISASITKKRNPIGRREEPINYLPPKNQSLWYGPSPESPIFRTHLHYDWHWDWRTGTGEMGNWGIHVLDDILNVALKDELAFPDQVTCGGGRILWDDAGTTPNLQYMEFIAGQIPIAFGLTNLPVKPGATTMPHLGGPPGHGCVVQCEAGQIVIKRGKAAIYDNSGRKIQSLKDDAGTAHQENFIESIRRNDPSLLNAPVNVGQTATDWCILANLAYLIGTPGQQPRFSTAEVSQNLLTDVDSHLQNHQLSTNSEFLSGSSAIDPSDLQQFERIDLNENARQMIEGKGRNEFRMPQTNSP